MRLLYYQKNREQFQKEYSTHLTDDEVRTLFKKLKTRLHFRHELLIMGNAGGNCNSWRVKVCRNPSIGIFAHEVAHAVQFRKRGINPSPTGAKWHTNEHTRIMARIIRFINKNLLNIKEQLAKKKQKELIARQNKLVKAHLKEMLRQSASYKLTKLKEAENRAITRFKRASTHLKKIQRRIKLWQKKADNEVSIKVNENDCL